MFEITADQSRRLLHIRMWGFWDAATMAAYSVEVKNKMASLLRGLGCKSILIDMIDYPIQSKEIANTHADFLRVVRDRGESRVAIVMQSALSKLQASRVANDTGHRTFDTIVEAQAWLDNDDN